MSKVDALRVSDYLGHIAQAIIQISRVARDMDEKVARRRSRPASNETIVVTPYNGFQPTMLVRHESLA